MGQDNGDGTHRVFLKVTSKQLTGVLNRWLYIGTNAAGMQGIKLLEFLEAEEDENYPNKRQVELSQEIRNKMQEYKSRPANVNRRLLEIGYYAFIGLNLFLLCCLTFGVCCVCRQGGSTRHLPYQPIRW